MSWRAGGEWKTAACRAGHETTSEFTLAERDGAMLLADPDPPTSMPPTPNHLALPGVFLAAAAGPWPRWRHPPRPKGVGGNSGCFPAEEGLVAAAMAVWCGGFAVWAAPESGSTAPLSGRRCA